MDARLRVLSRLREALRAPLRHPREGGLCFTSAEPSTQGFTEALR